ncbi:DNA cytosine methyltransferase [Dialister invisus]|uniref:DNA cytosine methyltransferase n=1 Tax=Dialister invisus TaxID=218538 RepID=UPI002671DB10|nr:DNA (cytosine-5-)-methyltransferase [Dialister invisus]
MNSELLTVTQAAEYLKLSDKTVRRLIKKGDLIASKIGNRAWRIHSSDIDNYIYSTSNNTLKEYDAVSQNVKEERYPRLISLFSGCGGMDLGFKKAGFNIVWANDFDKDAQAVYSLNLGKIDGRDILDINEKEIPNGDILVAGFPCQPFSNAGNRKGVHDSRGLLYKECLRIIQEKNPKVIVFENVKGLLSSKYIDGRNLTDVIIADLENINGVGYEVIYQLVNSSDYGVPQNRQRVFFVGIRKDLGIKFSFPQKHVKKNLSLKNILDIPEGVENNVDWAFSPQALAMIEFIPEGGSWKDVPYEHLAPRFQKIRDNMKKYHSPNFYRRFSRNEICGTMTASAQPENCGIIHPTENRRYTVREVARIQSFPDDFKFITDSPKNITAMYKVIGNAVPTILAYNIAKSIMEQVFSKGEALNEH